MNIPTKYVLNKLLKLYDEAQQDYQKALRHQDVQEKEKALYQMITVNRVASELIIDIEYKRTLKEMVLV
jgi:hypothetical protein